MAVFTKNELANFMTTVRIVDMRLLRDLYGIIKRGGDPAKKPVALSLIRAEVYSRVVGPKGRLP